MNSEAASDILPVAPGIFTLPPYEQSQPRLLGGFCQKCNQYYFPKPRYCRVCLGEVQKTSLGSEGTIYSFTVIRRKAPLGLPEPYPVGYIDLIENDLRIFCLLDPEAIDQFRIGLAVQLGVGVLGTDGRGEPVLRPYFTPLNTTEKKGK